MYAIDFFYDKEKLSDYNMMICSFDGKGTETVSSGADITFNQVKHTGVDYNNISSVTYEAYTTTFQICKRVCGVSSQEEFYLTPDELSAIQRWLCRKDYFKFKIDQDDFLNIYWNATFSSKKIEINGRTVGLELTMSTDAPFAYLDELEIDFDCTGGEVYHLYDYSDEIGFIYPDVEITFLEAGDFKLENSMDDEILKIDNVSYGEKIKLDGRNQIPILLDGEHPTLAKDFNYFFPKIINTYENNQNDFTPSLDCKLTFIYSPIRKVGL